MHTHKQGRAGYSSTTLLEPGLQGHSAPVIWNQVVQIPRHARGHQKDITIYFVSYSSVQGESLYKINNQSTEISLQLLAEPWGLPTTRIKGYHNGHLEDVSYKVTDLSNSPGSQHLN